jgi:hypothetical protein
MIKCRPKILIFKKSITFTLLLIVSQLSFSQIDLKKELLNSKIIKTDWISLEKTDTISELNETLYLTHFQYGQYRDWGYAIWQDIKNTFNLLWLQLDSSDYPPHTFSCVDFNSDNKMDLLLLAGEDEEFYTRVFINYSKEYYSHDNFVLKYYNDYVYSSILDIDQDGKPEILDSGINPIYRDSSIFYLTSEQEKELSNIYDSMTQSNNFNNFTYGVPGSYKIYNMFLEDEIVIYQFINNNFIDNTRLFKDHIIWRIKFLTDLKKDPRNDSKHIDALIEYFKIKLN